tara:strand:- start:264 stop:467 length:204 start_codon:yes stop_codon:yes gene_type:complete
MPPGFSMFLLGFDMAMAVYICSRFQSEITEPHQNVATEQTGRELNASGVTNPEGAKELNHRKKKKGQ